MAWGSYYRGDGVARPIALPPPPPWREFPRRPLGLAFRPPPGLPEAVNAALTLRRPLLLTGPPGSGKSTVIESVARELKLGPVLRWHITSRSTLTEALYRYDVLGRIHEQQLTQARDARRASETNRTGGVQNTAADDIDDIAPFLRLGPLGTALVPAPQPRALLIDEIDKSDLDLPGDLLDVLERGEYEIAELARYSSPVVAVRLWDSQQTHPIQAGRLRCTEFPFIVMTSNDERDFPPAFLRRCLRFAMPEPTVELLRDIVGAHLGMHVPQNAAVEELLSRFLARLHAGESLAIDQLLNAVFILTGDDAPQGAQRDDLLNILLHELTHA
ncbi:ATP-binding protein [Actinomadura graeca]|uniref:ATP-binding protein n=1 Tax=Actinomadura graeca TaxID=2750812 RepID=A0ABX8R5T2_9ACTN|nr:AAA family ATPase [Actinomadura graeca]QXJ25774.1 ATP-binding protein [Actinomadura graeca]